MSEISYYTEEGLSNLKNEIKNLESVERPKISQQIAEARDKGDLSENAEYDAAKEAQGMLEARISKLKNKLANVLIISDTDSMKNINKSARNIKNVKLIKDEGTNIYDLFKYKNVIITSSSAKKIQDRILNEKN